MLSVLGNVLDYEKFINNYEIYDIIVTYFFQLCTYMLYENQSNILNGMGIYDLWHTIK